MRPNRAPTRHERLVNDLTNAAIDLQGLAQRLSNTEGLSVTTRSHALRLAEAGRSAALAAVNVNEGNTTDTLMLFYGEYLTTSAKRRDNLNPLTEMGCQTLYDSPPPASR